MYCQKCRSSLKPEHSLDSLNPAAFDLLIGMPLRTSTAILLSGADHLTQIKQDLQVKLSQNTPPCDRPTPAIVSTATESPNNPPPRHIEDRSPSLAMAPGTKAVTHLCGSGAETPAICRLSCSQSPRLDRCLE